MENSESYVGKLVQYSNFHWLDMSLWMILNAGTQCYMCRVRYLRMSYP